MIILNNVVENCKKTIFFSCQKECIIYTDDINKGMKVNSGSHKIEIARHHDLFFDWFIDNQLVEEFVVYVLMTSEEKLLCIKSTEDIILVGNEELEIQQSSFTILPYVLELNLQLIKFSLICNKQSQLSFYFQKEKEKPKDYQSLTLFFEKDYCKVYLDTTIDDKYQPDKRKNLSLFKTDIGVLNSISINKDDKKMLIYNDIQKSKEYNLEDIDFIDKKYLVINESYKPNGSGIYIIQPELPTM